MNEPLDSLFGTELPSYFSRTVVLPENYGGEAQGVLSNTHPAAKKLDDGSFLCEECGAESFNLEFLDRLSCTNALDTSSAEPKARIGDVWREDEDSVWVRGMDDDNEYVWFDAGSTQFNSIRAKTSAAPIAEGINPAVRTLRIKGSIVAGRRPQTETLVNPSSPTRRLRDHTFQKMTEVAKAYQTEIDMYRITPMRQIIDDYDRATRQEYLRLEYEVRPKP